MLGLLTSAGSFLEVLLFVLSLSAEILPVVDHELLDAEKSLIANVWITVRQQLHHTVLSVELFDDPAARQSQMISTSKLE